MHSKQHIVFALFVEHSVPKNFLPCHRKLHVHRTNQALKLVMKEKAEKPSAEIMDEESSLAEVLRQSLQITNSNESSNMNQESTQAQVKKSQDGGTILNPIYISTPTGNDTWELTWPIWHMLPHMERKEIALQNGFQNIGDFEEEVILSRALNEETSGTNRGDGNNAEMYENADLYELENRPELYGLPTVAGRSPNNSQKKEVEIDECVDDESSAGSEDDNILLQQGIDQDDEKNVEEGGLILYLPDELILHHIFPFLSTEYYVVCSLVSSHWKSFTRSELAYKEICKRSYLNQSKRKTLRVGRFGGSYRSMLERRFRLKTGCGLYVLKCTKIKEIQRDMWTEIPFGTVLEATYYRYLYFFENGIVLYSLTSRPPHEQMPIFQKVLATNETQHSAVFGTYEIQKDQCVVCIEHPWHHVRLFLKVMENGCEGAVGKFWSLKFEKHQSSASNDFDEYWSRDLVEYDVPHDPFRFLRDWRL